MLDIPTVPAAIITLLGFFAPYAIALVNRPEWSTNTKRIVAVFASLVLAAIALVIYFVATGEPIPEWWTMLLLCVVVTQASHSLIMRESADKLELATSKIDAGTAGTGPSKITSL